MRSRWLFMAAAVAVLAPYACGEDETGGSSNNNPTTASGSGGSGGASSSATNPTSTNSSSSASTGVVASSSTGSSGITACGAPLEGRVQCDPVTQQPCNVAAGEACDVSQGGFECYPDGNVHDLCDECGLQGDYCKAGMTCSISYDGIWPGHCYRYCCDDADCGPGNTCFMGFDLQVPAGLCIAGAPGGVGGGGVGGAGGAGGAGVGGSGGAGGAPDCTGILTASACATCLETNCCAIVAQCGALTGCLECENDHSMCNATEEPVAKAFNECLSANCTVDCGSAPAAACDAPGL